MLLSLRRLRRPAGAGAGLRGRGYLTVIDRSEGYERAFDLYSRLLQERVVFLNGEIHDGLAQAITAQLLFLEAEHPRKPIAMYINSPGGSVSAGLGIYDTMQYVTPPVQTICVGRAASMGSLLLAAGEPGMRMALPHSRVMLHQPSGGAQGMASDIQIVAEEIIELRKVLNQLFVQHTGQDLPCIERTMDRDTYLSAEAAQEFGIVDKVLASRKGGPAAAS